MQLTRGGRFLRRSIKRFIYSQLALRESLMIFFRNSDPLVLVNVEDDPPSSYINVRSDRAALGDREPVHGVLPRSVGSSQFLPGGTPDDL